MGLLLSGFVYAARALERMGVLSSSVSVKKLLGLFRLNLTIVLVFRVSTLKTEFLPLLSVSFVSESSVVAAVSFLFTSPLKTLLNALGREQHGLCDLLHSHRLAQPF